MTSAKLSGRQLPHSGYLLTDTKQLHHRKEEATPARALTATKNWARRLLVKFRFLWTWRHQNNERASNWSVLQNLTTRSISKTSEKIVCQRKAATWESLVSSVPLGWQEDKKTRGQRAWKKNQDLPPITQHLINNLTTNCESDSCHFSPISI